MTCEAWRRASERYPGVWVMRDRSFARGLSSGNGATVKCHEVWRLRAMLYEGSTGQLFGVFTKAAEVHGCCICVGRAFRECY